MGHPPIPESLAGEVREAWDAADPPIPWNRLVRSAEWTVWKFAREIRRTTPERAWERARPITDHAPLAEAGAFGAALTRMVGS